MNSAAMYPPGPAPPPMMLGNMPGGVGAGVYPPLSAPTANMFGNMPGYEGIGAAGGFLPPPMPAEPVAPPQPGAAPDSWVIPALQEDVARAAFKDFANSKCCYGSGPAEEGVITNMEPFNTFRYRLETFTESRSTEMAQKPHEGETADFYTQPAPRPWEVEVQAPALFTNHTEEKRVPYTSSIKECDSCHSKGTKACEKCTGSGHNSCLKCNGSGKEGEQNCSACNATGKDRCSTCSGRGTIQCNTCKGKKQLLTYVKLKVEWKTQTDTFFAEQNSGLKVDDLSSVSGKELFKYSQCLVYPLHGFPNASIFEASDRLIKEHQTKFAQTSRILQQRHVVDLVPITKVNYKWKTNMHVFYVYGNENKVSAEDYPATCCCVIL
ncbi:protein SSUH2 homolog isoform X1 [Nothobranchius furzeri]|uniref:Transcript variant X1 n=2 Tax=Nothobranchius furzeri TaxID=105023 RepID=A0A1A8B379_NOTFU|nr:protein SSUH2 homolog isoform X1 [Nothobranchius furzeri]KAF7207597.1 transcript variant X1 [Nothobranchius furzeri]